MMTFINLLCRLNTSQLLKVVVYDETYKVVDTFTESVVDIIIDFDNKYWLYGMYQVQLISIKDNNIIVTLVEPEEREKER